MVKHAFRELNLVLPNFAAYGKEFFFAGEQLHGVTHAHALNGMKHCRYRDLVKAGVRNHRIQMHLNR